jgi:hypothetical protein
MSNLSNQTSLLTLGLPFGANAFTPTLYQTLIPSYSTSPSPQPITTTSGFDYGRVLSSPPATSITEPQKTNHIKAIIKIGSNTGSLTITDLVNKHHTESDKFNLGEGLSEQNDVKKLKKENIESSLETMERWAQVMTLYGITECEIVATESLRAASDGKEYLNQAIKILNAANPTMIINDRIIKPQEEAELSVETVKSQLGEKIKDGYVVDYGGASCEISKLLNNELAKNDEEKGLFSSLKIGAHPLIAELKKSNNGKELWGENLSALIPSLKEKITTQLNTLTFIDREESSQSTLNSKSKKNEKTLYLIGGSLRKAGESIMEEGETLNDIKLSRKDLLDKLERRQENLLKTIQANNDQPEVKRLDYLKELVSNTALISLLEKMPKKTKIKFIENGMVDALISRETREKGVKLAEWLTKWIQTILPGELSEEKQKTIKSAATYSYRYASNINSNISEANRVKQVLEGKLQGKEDKDQILNILIPSMIGKDSINTSGTDEGNFNKLAAQLLKLAKLISFNNPEILNRFKLTKNSKNNEISLESESSPPQAIHKLANGGKVNQALGRINKIYKEITEGLTKHT